MSEKLIELQKEVNEALELQKEGVLKGEKANELMTKLRDNSLLSEFKNNIIKLKFEQLQNSIDTLWKDRKGYNSGDNFTKRKNLIDLELGNPEGILKENEEQSIQLENTSIEETNELITGFKEVKDIFIAEEKRWLLFSLLGLIYLTLIAIVLGLGNGTLNLFNDNSKYGITPLFIIFFSFEYFSLYQYSKAKNLRIDYLNRIAVLHGFQALRTQQGEGIGKSRFYDNIANVVFTKVYTPKNDQNLPIDRIIDLVKTTIESTTKK